MIIAEFKPRPNQLFIFLPFYIFAFWSLNLCVFLNRPNILQTYKIQVKLCFQITTSFSKCCVGGRYCLRFTAVCQVLRSCGIPDERIMFLFLGLIFLFFFCSRFSYSFSFCLTSSALSIVSFSLCGCRLVASLWR